MSECTSLYQQAVALWKEIQNSSLRGDSPEFQTLLDGCKDKFAELGRKVNELCLFSTNETIHDIQTSSVPYIMIPYHLALIEQKRMEDRKKHLNNAKVGKSGST